MTHAGKYKSHYSKTTKMVAALPVTPCKYVMSKSMEKDPCIHTCLFLFQRYEALHEAFLTVFRQAYTLDDNYCTQEIKADARGTRIIICIKEIKNKDAWLVLEC